ncbi:M1 family metallopeptidase [Streptomyces sp. NPDC091377]|uniref:M1 family metallopeptidase n=1 Tax=Streptomyces sp. NPDC091377 TaxID=3365995 RepID=UPI0038278CE6
MALTLLTGATACTTTGGGSGSPGGSGLGDPYFPESGNGGYDVRHYALDLAYVPADRRLTGRALITARAAKRLSAFDLDLQGLAVETVEVDGKKARWQRQGQELTVSVPAPIGKGADFRVAVRYAGNPETVTDPDGSKEGWLPTADGALALGQPVGSMAWFPGNHHPSDKATYDMAVTVPEGLAAVSNGEPVAERTSGGRTTFTWRTGAPMASYLATVAIGRFEVSRTVTEDGLALHTAVDPSEAEASREVLGRIPEVLEWSGERFGPYPFSSAGAIVDKADGLGYALETQNRPVFPGAPTARLLVHEIAHQWYGNSVSPRTWRDMWLNEGFATYAEWMWEEDEGGLSAEETFDALYSGTYYDDPGENAAVWSFPPGDPPDAAHISGQPVYDRAAMVLHRLRAVLGERAFTALLRDWPATHRHGNASTEDFMTYVEALATEKTEKTGKTEKTEKTGKTGKKVREVRGVWKDWLFGKKKPPRP